ncbi:MAG: hypothetical protein GXP26_05010 [Planctomycetes bacterium]|nr:hypothetical protein [Planctomycetota bacterium]
MIAINETNLASHAKRFQEYARDLLKPLVNGEGRLNGEEEELYKVSRLLIQYMRLHLRKHWPSDSTYAICLMAEVASIAVICKHRCPDSTQKALRPILQSLYHNLTEAIDSQPASIAERKNHTADFGVISFASHELDVRAAQPQETL